MITDSPTNSLPVIEKFTFFGFPSADQRVPDDVPGSFEIIIFERISASKIAAEKVIPHGK